MSNYPARKGVSRTAEKFVVRLPDQMREDIAAKALEQHMSMNGLIVNAIEAYLGGDDLRHSLQIEIEAVKLLRGMTDGAKYERERLACQVTAENCDLFRQHLDQLYRTLGVEDQNAAMATLALLHANQLNAQEI